MISQDLFEWEQLRRTLFGVLLRDLSVHNALPGAPLETERFMSDPLYKDAVDEAFLSRLLEDVKTRYVGLNNEVPVVHASLGFDLAQKYGSPLMHQFLLVLLENAMLAGANDVAERSARLGIEELGDGASPEFLSRCYEVLGYTLYNRGDYQHAIPLFEEGANYANATEDVHGEWDRLTNVVACYHRLGEYLESLHYVDRTETLARKMGNPTALAKSLLDRGNAELNLQHIDQAGHAFVEGFKVAKEAKDEQIQSDCLGNLGIVCFLKGQLKEAETHHRRALEISRRIPSEESEQFDLGNLAQVLWDQQKGNEAVQCLVEAIGIAERRGDNESIYDYREELRENYRAMGLYQKARAVDELINPPPVRNDVASPREVGLTQPSEAEVSSEGREWERAFNEKMKAGEVEEAGQLVGDFIAQHPEDWAGYFHQGLFWNMTGQFRESIQAYERAMELNPNAIEPHYNILNSWRSLGDLQTPLRRYETLVQDSPFDPVLRTALGRAYGLSGHHDEAIRNLREAVRLDPQSYMTRLSLAQELFKKAMSLLSTDWFAAWAYFEECSTSFLRLVDMDAERRPNSYTLAGESFEQMAIESYFVQPALLSAKMDTKELHVLGFAASFYRKSIELAPHLSRPQEGYARVMNAIHRFADASGLTTVGAVLRSEGEENEAFLFLEMSGALDPDRPATHYQRALLYLKQAVRDPSALRVAEDAIQQAIALEPDNPDYAVVLRRIQRRRADFANQSEEPDK